jgi:hypothetical protein
MGFRPKDTCVAFLFLSFLSLFSLISFIHVISSCFFIFSLVRSLTLLSPPAAPPPAQFLPPRLPSSRIKGPATTCQDAIACLPPLRPLPPAHPPLLRKLMPPCRLVVWQATYGNSMVAGGSMSLFVPRSRHRCFLLVAPCRPSSPSCSFTVPLLFCAAASHSLFL